MAKRSKSKKHNLQPAEMTFTLVIPVGPTSSVDATADLSQIASLLNRRFYRQGLNWAVAGFKVKSGTTGAIDISKLPTSWVYGNSWTKGFKTWQQMNEKALDTSESVEGRFLDFKIYADEIHHSAGFASNLLPIDAVGNFANAGEWIPSEIRIPNSAVPGTSTALEILGVGASYPGAGASGKDAVSLVEGYASSRALPSEADPNTPADLADASGATPENWIAALANQGVNQDSGVLDDVQAYDQPPYPYENDGVSVDTMYPGGANQLPALMPHDFQNFTGTTISNITYLKGGNFPCGLVRLKATNTGDEPDTFIVQIDMVPGNHRGYMAESMMEM